MEWTPELIHKVRRFAERDGKSAPEIAEALGSGITKNMIVSLAYRVRPRIRLATVSVRASAQRAKTMTALPVPAASVPRLRFVIVDEIHDPVHHSALRAGDRRCRFPLWPDRLGTAQRPAVSELMYCGKKTEPGSSWCPECRAKVYEPSRARVEPGKGRKVNADGRRTGWQYGT